MKVNSIQRDMTLKQGNLRLRSGSQNFREKNSAGVYENRGYNADYCGSFTGKSEAAATALKKGFTDKILSSKWFGSFAKYSHEHNISTSALIALVLAGVMRPATIMALPGKDDKEDKIYASGHAMASGIIGFLVSTAITSPFDESIKKFFEDPDKYMIAKKSAKAGRKGSKPTLERMKNAMKYLEGKVDKATTAKYYEPMLEKLTKQTSAMETLAKNIPDWVIGVPRAILTIALIPPILKYVFGVEKKKKAEPQKDTTVNNNNNMEMPKMDFIEKPAFQQFKGGVK